MFLEGNFCSFKNWTMMSSWKQLFLPQHNWVMSIESWKRLSLAGEKAGHSSISHQSDVRGIRSCTVAECSKASGEWHQVCGALFYSMKGN